MSETSFSGKRIWVTGHNGMVGSALVRQLSTHNDIELLTADRKNLDLENQSDTLDWVAEKRPDIIINCAAKVGGIDANRNFPADFMSENLRVALNVIESAVRHNVGKLVCLGSSCFYPKHSPQPITESSLLQGGLEPTNEAYALAKIATIKLCEFYSRQYNRNFIGIVPTNLYGSGDNFSPKHGHVISALIHKFVEANEKNLPHVNLWGTGKPLREFMHVDDAARGILFLTQQYSKAEHINLCGGETVSIYELATLIKSIVGYSGDLLFDRTKPDGMMKKSLDTTLLAELGWQPIISLHEGLCRTIDEYQTGYLNNEV